MLSAVLSILIIVWDFVGNYTICDTVMTNGAETYCPEILTAAGLTVVPILPLFLFSLITYFMREEVFKLWVKVAIPLALVSMMLIYLTPEQYAGGFGTQLSVGKGDTALASTVVLVVVSVVVIVIGYLRIRKS